MRWREIGVLEAEEPQALPGLRLPGLLRTVRTPEFAGVVFHEVAARSALNRVPGQTPLPFSWTVNPYRGCTHACVYCFARRTHTFLELDTGRDFDSQIIVKVNIGQVLAKELRSPRWTREPVAMGTNTDPYQRAEGRYRLMPQIIAAFADSGTPFSILTKGTLLARDLPQLAGAARQVQVGLGVSIALVDRDLQPRLEPGTPAPAARLDLVRRISDAGLACGVMVAPVLPWLTDSAEALDAVLGRIGRAGAVGATVIPLHLRPGTREWFMAWLAREYPSLVDRYERLYRRGANADLAYRKALAERVHPLLRRHGLERSAGPADGWPRPRAGGDAAGPVAGRNSGGSGADAGGYEGAGSRPWMPRGPQAGSATRQLPGPGSAAEQLSLL